MTTGLVDRLIVENAASWMVGRGWRQKLAKKRGQEQSLFEHSLIELDVLIDLLPILADPRHYSLSEVEQRILAVSVLAHDLGKETDAWQEYVREPQRVGWIPHILPELTRATVPEICDAFGFEALGEPVQLAMAHCAQFHHSKPGRSDGAIMEAMLAGGTDRFLTLAYLVRAIDHLCSAANAGEAQGAIENDPALGQHLRASRHEVMIRGVSTCFLHRASRATFHAKGWRSLLYFSNATLYAADPNDQPVVPTVQEVCDSLGAEIDRAAAQDIASVMVGSPTGNILPKPALIAFSESRQYLQSAAKKISPQSFAKKPLAAKRKVVEDYYRLKGEGRELTQAQVQEEAGRISVAQPEMLVFKFFKAMMDPGKVEVVGKDGAALAEALYEQTFGHGTWAALQSTSTIMPARDMAKTVDCFWALSGKDVNHPEVELVGHLPDQTRLQVLIDVLNDIAQRVYNGIARPSPRDKLSQMMARAFIEDLLRPRAGAVQALAEEQLAHYVKSKPFAGKESSKGVYTCPICNAPFGFNSGIKASADFIDNPQTHSNRGVAHGRFDYIMVCATCYYERLLVRMLLGSPPAEMITLFPRLNLGPEKGEQLVRRVREWVEAAQGQMRGETGNLAFGFSLGFTDQAARRMGDRDPLSLEPGELLALFSYRFTTKKQKERKQEAIKRLKEEFDDDLNTLNVACAESFATWDAVVDAFMENRLDQDELVRILKPVFRLGETMQLICQTPNLIFIPLTYEVAAGEKESETSKALRRLYVALVLSLVFDASVAIQQEGQAVDSQAGAAYVPPVPAVRSLVGYDWIPVVEGQRWLSAIGAASLLVQDSGLPSRSALYQILAADPPERIARRIEESGSRKLALRHLLLIAQLPKFHKAKEEKEVHQ